jgi:hypothetical protein
MGYSKAQKEKTHKRIVAIASERFRMLFAAGIGSQRLRRFHQSFVRICALSGAPDNAERF